MSSRICLAVLVGLVGAAVPARGGDAILPETLRAIKAATVYIKVETSDGTGSGSGFVLRVEGREAFIATNHHVVDHPGRGKQENARPKVTVVFDSGTKSERSLPAEVIASDPDRTRDLAILRISNVADLPAPIAFAPPEEVFETEPVYVFGFPFGKFLDPERPNPAITVGTGTVSSFRANEFGRRRRVQIDGDLNPGNSGGPVVDAHGRLVGIAVATLFGTRIGLAVPPEELTRMLDGRVERMDTTLLALSPHAAELEFTVHLIDPLKRIKAVQLRYAKAIDVPIKIPMWDDLTWPLIPGEVLDLPIAGPTAKGRLKLALPGPVDHHLLLQETTVSADGRVRGTGPVEHIIDELEPAPIPRPNASPVVSKASGPKRPLGPWGLPTDPDGDCQFRVDVSRLRITLPATPHDLQPEKSVVNAPRVLIDGPTDFAARVFVPVAPNPRGPRVLANRPALQAAGLILWKDAQNYVVFLRYVMREQRRQSHMILLQARRAGKRTCTETVKVPADESSFLMLSRRDGEVRGLFGPDGRRWLAPENLSTKFQDAAQVGVTAWNLTTAPYVVELTDFAVTDPPPPNSLLPGVLLFDSTGAGTTYASAAPSPITNGPELDRSGRWDLNALSEMMTKTPVLVVVGAVLACLLALWVRLKGRAPRPVARDVPPPNAAAPDLVLPILQELQDERNAVANNPERAPDPRPEGS